jgi:hypothetical protein
MKKLILLILPILSLACLSTGYAGFTPSAGPARTKTAIPPTPPTRMVVPPSTAIPDPACATVNTDSLHVRYEPNEHAQAIGWVTEGTVVKILDDSGDWWKINGAGIDDQGRQARMTGYVNSDFLKECEP